MRRIGGVTPRLAVLAGTLALAGAAAVVLSAPAGATTVSTEKEFRDAWTNDAETQIDLANDIVLSDGGGCTGVSVRPNTAALPIVLDGHGHTITQQCPNNGVLRDEGSGALTVSNLTITGGSPSSGAGGLRVDGDVTLNNSVVTGNIRTGLSIGGVGVLNNSVVSNNHAGNFATAGIGFGSLLTLQNSTVSGNTAGHNATAGIGTGSGKVMLINSTVTNNSTVPDDSPDNVGGVRSSDITLVYSTIAGNNSNTIANLGPNLVQEKGQLTSFGSVVALPVGGGTNCANLAGTTSNGFNFSDDSSCGYTASTDKQSAGDPGLGPLGDNGGPTQTRLPQPGSPLIDAIPVASCQADGASGITTDQRGVSRPQGPGCDIGAVEVEVPGPTSLAPPAAAAPPVEAVVRFTG